MGCNLVSILFLATTSLLDPVRLGEKVRGMRLMWGIKIRIPVTARFSSLPTWGGIKKRAPLKTPAWEATPGPAKTNDYPPISKNMA